MSTIPVRGFDDEHYLVFATKKGIIKKTRLSSYQHVRASGIIAIKIDEDDEVIDTAISDGSKQIILATSKGMAVRFDEGGVRPTGRATYGVRGIRLRKDDSVVCMAVVTPQSQLLTLTETGFGKRTLVEEYRKTRRGGLGVIAIKTGGRNGSVVSAREVTDDTELIITSKAGMVIRTPASQVRMVHRATMGVTIMRLRPRDKICAVAALIGAMEEERLLSEGRTLTPNGGPEAPEENGEEKPGDENGKEDE
jgi:DNA gyrase subunit A